MVTQVFVLCVSNAENSPMVMSGLGGSLRLQIAFPETIPLPITYHYMSNTTLLHHGWYSEVLFATALQVPGGALVPLGKKKNGVTGTFYAVIISKVPGGIHQATLENSVASR